MSRPHRTRRRESHSCEDLTRNSLDRLSREASLSPELRGCLIRNWLDNLSRGISEPRIARMCQAKLAGPPQVRASPNPEFRGRLRRNWPDHPRCWRMSLSAASTATGPQSAQLFGEARSRRVCERERKGDTREEERSEGEGGQRGDISSWASLAVRCFWRYV